MKKNSVVWNVTPSILSHRRQQLEWIWRHYINRSTCKTIN